MLPYMTSQELYEENVMDWLPQDVAQTVRDLAGVMGTSKAKVVHQAINELAERVRTAQRAVEATA